MADLRFALVIGDKAYSSWSLRAWLALHHASGAAGFQEINIELAGAGSDEQRAHIRKFSPNGKVPALIDRAGGGGGGAGLVVWDSLAICEFVSDCFPAAGLWPDDPRDRAVARSAAAEMHSAFGALRSAMPMNVRRRGLAVSPDEHDLAAVAQDVDRVCELYTQTVEACDAFPTRHALDKADSLWNLTRLPMVKATRPADCVTMLQQVVDIYKECLGDEHEETMAARRVLRHAENHLEMTTLPPMTEEELVDMTAALGAGNFDVLSEEEVESD